MNVLNKLKKLLSKDYRDDYMQTHVRTGIAYQMQAMRSKLGISQSEMGEKLDKPQSVVSRYEDTEAGKVSVQTLLDIASSLDVALVVRFVSYPEFLEHIAKTSERELQPDTIYESQEPAHAMGRVLRPKLSHENDWRAKRDREHRIDATNIIELKTYHIHGSYVAEPTVTTSMSSHFRTPDRVVQVLNS